MNTLSIPVWRKPAKKERQRVMIKIFEDTSNSEGSCVVPITDAVLESRIKNVATDDASEIQDAIQRAKDYTRAIGRIMLHSFVNGHTVSSTVIAPFFINGEPTMNLQSFYLTMIMSDQVLFLLAE